MSEGETNSPELEEDVGIVRAAVGAYGRAVADGEIEGFLDLLEDDADLEIPSALRQDVVKLHGRDEIALYLKETADEYVEMRVVPRQFRLLDHGRLLVVGRWQGRASGGTTPFGTPMAMIVELRAGKVSRMRAFMDEQQALDAVGGD